MKTLFKIQNTFYYRSFESEHQHVVYITEYGEASRAALGPNLKALISKK
jgi:hypothetical protein